jgi:putative SOS response-associated peptidase YedK
MCGRYRLSKRKQLIEEYFETANEVDWEPRYNIAPSQNVGIIRQDPSRPRREFSKVRWGLIPCWAKEPSIGHQMINARSETVADKPAFREAFKNRRCLVPADGFYEWARNGKAKQPFHFGMQTGSLFAFAGIWDQWRDTSGNLVETCSILTTTPNSLLAAVHDRMPVILETENYELWLDPGFKYLDALSEMLVPFNPNLMKGYPVSIRVNAPKNDDPECAAEIALVNTMEEAERLLPGLPGIPFRWTG